MDDTTQFLNNLEFDEAQDSKDAALSFWKALDELGFPEPTVGVGVEGNIHFSWRDDRDYLECEFFDSEYMEAFHEENLGEGKTDFVKKVENRKFHSPKSAANWIKHKTENEQPRI